MKKRMILLLSFVMILFLWGCVDSKPTSNVGGWNSNEGQTEQPDDSTQEEGVHVEEIEVNTDPIYEGLTIEIVEYFSNYVIYKVTNNSDVCYDYLSATIYFNCPPLPNRRTYQEGEGPEKYGYFYRDVFGMFDIPAYSTTYHLYHALGEEMSTDKGGTEDGRVYYDFDYTSDPYVVEIDEDWSQVSDERMQNASEYLQFDRSSYSSTNMKLGTVKNVSNRDMMISGFVVFMNGTVGQIINGFDDHSEYSVEKENIIPAMNTTIPCYDDAVCDKTGCQPTFKACDSNSIYVEEAWVDENFTISEHFDIYINAWFVEE